MQYRSKAPEMHKTIAIQYTRMMERNYITRTMEEVIKEAAQYFSVISVTGPRQSGKSTLLKQEGEITAIEVKSSMTYNKSFEKSLSQIDKWIQTPVVRKVVVYTGDFENTAGDIKVVNYRNLGEMLG